MQTTKRAILLSAACLLAACSQRVALENQGTEPITQSEAPGASTPTDKSSAAERDVPQLRAQDPNGVMDLINAMTGLHALPAGQVADITKPLDPAIHTQQPIHWYINRTLYDSGNGNVVLNIECVEQKMGGWAEANTAALLFLKNYCYYMDSTGKVIPGLKPLLTVGVIEHSQNPDGTIGTIAVNFPQYNKDDMLRWYEGTDEAAPIPSSMLDHTQPSYLTGHASPLGNFGHRYTWYYEGGAQGFLAPYRNADREILATNYITTISDAQYRIARQPPFELPGNMEMPKKWTVTIVEKVWYGYSYDEMIAEAATQPMQQWLQQPSQEGVEHKVYSEIDQQELKAMLLAWNTLRATLK